MTAGLQRRTKRQNPTATPKVYEAHASGPPFQEAWPSRPLGLHSNRVSSNRSLCFREAEFFAQRQRRRNVPGKFTETLAETKLTPQLGQLRASYRTAGKSLRKSECVVEEAVTVEPVSSQNSR